MPTNLCLDMKLDRWGHLRMTDKDKIRSAANFSRVLITKSNWCPRSCNINNNGFLRPEVLQLHLLASRPRAVFLVDRLPLLSLLHHLRRALRLLLRAERNHGHASHRRQISPARGEKHGQHESIRRHLML